MSGTFASIQFASTLIANRPGARKLKIACIGDSSSHGGTIISHNQDGRLLAKGDIVAADRCIHSCPLTGHGDSAVYSVMRRTYVNGKLIVTEQAVAGCGALITPPARGVVCE